MAAYAVEVNLGTEPLFIFYKDFPKLKPASDCFEKIKDMVEADPGVVSEIRLWHKDTVTRTWKPARK